MTDPNRATILHVITSLSRGGAQKNMIATINELNKFGYDQCIYNLTGENFYTQEISKIDVPVENFKIKKNLKSVLLGLVNLSRSYKKRSETQNIKTVAWMYDACLFSFLFVQNKKSIIFNIRHTLGNIFRESKKTILFAICVGLLSRFVGKTIFCSARSERQHRLLGYKKSLVIDNYVALSSQNNLVKPSDATIVIGCFARFSPMKRHLQLIRDFHFISKLQPRLLIVGCGAEEFKNSVLNQGYDLKNIDFIDECSDLNYYFSFIDMFVLYSGWGESFPNVLVEAINHGILTYATDVGAAKDIVGDEFCFPVSYKKNILRDMFLHYSNLSTSELIQKKNNQKLNLTLKFNNQIVTQTFIDALSDINGNK